jgi:hypothetical protein
MCTLHANSAREAVVKMCILPLLAGEHRLCVHVLSHSRSDPPAGPAPL